MDPVHGNENEQSDAEFEVTRAEAATPAESPQVRPWVRYWARVLDVYLFALVMGMLLPMFGINLMVLPGGDAAATMLLLLLWVFVESFLLIMTGTTPGKWFLKIRLQPADDLNFEYLDALKRSAKVWVMGLGLGLPIISLVTLILSYSKLSKEGITAWDRDGGFTVEHGTIGWLRIGILVVLLGGFIGLLILGAAAPR